jgi:hypothetical protein
MFSFYTAVSFNMFKQNGVQSDLKKDYHCVNKYITLLLTPTKMRQEQLLKRCNGLYYLNVQYRKYYYFEVEMKDLCSCMFVSNALYGI